MTYTSCTVNYFMDAFYTYELYNTVVFFYFWIPFLTEITGTNYSVNCSNSLLLFVHFCHTEMLGKRRKY